MCDCKTAAETVADAFPGGSSWLTAGDIYMLEATEENGRDFVFSCGCWSDWPDHRCGNGMGEFRARYGCRCGAPDDCYCHESCSSASPEESCEAHRAEYAAEIVEDHAEAILLDVQRNLWN